MKNHAMAIFLAAYLLFLAAHAGFGGGTMPAAQGGGVEPERASYALEPASSAGAVRSEDKADKELASWDYQLLKLAVTNLEALSPADAAAAERTVETFNARVDELLEEFTDHGLAVGRDAAKAYQDGFFLTEYYDTASSSGTVMGEIVSVRIDRSGYTGGAHPNSYTTTCIFDLTAGQFILDPAQLADDPQGFRDGVANKLVEKAERIPENRGAYWQDYAEILSRWNEGAVLFDEEGMLAVYSTYELGPYAMGAVELRLTWEELSELMGNRGLERLGVEWPETAG